MASVPGPKGPQVRTAPLRLPSAPVDTTAAQALGAAAHVVDFAAKVREQEEIRLAEIRVNDADVQARKLETDILLNPKTGALNAQGLDAAPAMNTATDRLRQGLSKIETGLTTERERDLWAVKRQRLEADVERQLMGHVGQEVRRTDVTNHRALVENELGRIARTAGDTAAVDETLGRLVNEERLFADRNGIPPESATQRVAALRSAARVSQVRALVNADNVDAAVRVAALEAVQGDLTADGKADVQRLVEEGAIRVRSQAASESLLERFPQDEKAALAEARKAYTGAMEDAVVQRIEGRFADDRRLKDQSRSELASRLLGQVETTGSLDGITAADALAAKQAGLWSGLQLRARQVRNRTAPVTDWDTYERIVGMDADELRALNPAEYRSQLSDTDYKALLNMKAEVERTGSHATDARGMTEARLQEAVFGEVKRLGFLATAANRVGQLKGTDGLRFSALMSEVRTVVEEMQAGQNNRPLSRQQQLEAVASVMDDEVLRTSGRNRVVPRAMLGPGDDSRDLTPEEREGRIVPRPLAGETRETYYTRLIRRGFAPDSAQAVALREIVPTGLRVP